MSLQKTFVVFAILGLFIYGIMSFVIITQENNDAENKITDHDTINDTYGELYTQLTDAETETETIIGNFTRRSPTETFGELSVTSIFSPTSKLKTLTVGLWNILIQLPMKVLGVSPVVASTITSILSISLIIGMWLIWKGVST